MIEISCTNEQKVPVAVVPATAAGTPSAIEAGSLVITVQSGEGTAVKTDELAFECISGANPGDTVYLVEADSDLGEGVVTISDIITLRVEGAKASSLGLVAGPAVPK